jgi:hypothetical protein
MGEHRNDLCQLARSLVDIATGQVPHFKLTRYQIPPLPPSGYMHNLHSDLSHIDAARGAIHPSFNHLICAHRSVMASSRTGNRSVRFCTIFP